MSKVAISCLVYVGLTTKFVTLNSICKLYENFAKVYFEAFLKPIARLFKNILEEYENSFLLLLRFRSSIVTYKNSLIDGPITKACLK